MSTKKDSTYYIDHKGAGIKLGALLFDFLSSCDSSFRELVFICIEATGSQETALAR